MWLFHLLFFLTSANLICQGTDISKCFRESLGLRDNESRLHFHGPKDARTIEIRLYPENNSDQSVSSYLQWVLAECKMEVSTIYLMWMDTLAKLSELFDKADKVDKSSMFVCVEVLRPSQPNRVMSSAFSLPNHTFTGLA